MLVFEGLPQWRGLSQVTVGAFVYHAILAQAVATALWFVILGGLPAGVAAIGSLLVPAVGVIGAMTLIGERPTWGDLLGLVLIVSASAVVLLRFERARGASSR
jgi:drug/metabolite transporter (DMT)-like permease